MSPTHKSSAWNLAPSNLNTDLSLGKPRKVWVKLGVTRRDFCFGHQVEQGAIWEEPRRVPVSLSLAGEWRRHGLWLLWEFLCRHIVATLSAGATARVTAGGGGLAPGVQG